ncbi:MAG: hypothetical protein ABMA15_02330 [Vicinamibacterales bacterium]
MTSASLDRSFRTASLVGGWSLIAATVLFVAEFSYLSSPFEHPMILDRPASEVREELCHAPLRLTARAMRTTAPLIGFENLPWPRRGAA